MRSGGRVPRFAHLRFCPGAIGRLLLAVLAWRPPAFRQEMKDPLPKQVYQVLRERLLNGSISPGSRLDYKRLCADLGVSNTPVREAVARLATEGFVDLIPRLGAVVRSLDRGSAVHFYEVREAVETFAAAKAAERHSQRHLDLMHRHLDTMIRLHQGVLDRGESHLETPALHDFLDADLAFHQTILSACRNPELANTVRQSHIQARILYVFRGPHDTPRLSRACSQHAAILSALENRDGPAAAEAMRLHIQASLEFTFAHLDEMEERGL